MTTTADWMPDETERALLVASGLFDEAHYRAQTRLLETADAVGHYLQIGWQWGLEPNPGFQGAFLYPYYAAAGLNQAPLLTWIELDAMGGRAPRTEAEAHGLAGYIRGQALFDAERYARLLPAGMDPVLHYVIVGESMGWRPSPDFDPHYYGEKYPDVVAGNIPPLIHYLNGGQKEGRMTQWAAERVRLPPLPDTGRPVVIMLAHEASRTGAPILGWRIARSLAERYDIVTILMYKGVLEAEFEAVSAAVVGPLTYSEWQAPEMARVVKAAVDAYRPVYAIANSVVTSWAVPHLALNGVPVVALVHEFAAYTRPVENMLDTFDWAHAVVFPARLVAESAFEYFAHLNERDTVHVFPQGRVDPPQVAGQGDGGGETGRDVVAEMRAVGDEGAFTVLGVGSVHLRKGVDIFLSVAAAVRRLAPDIAFRFIWIGDGYDPRKDLSYSVYLAEQFARSGIGHTTALLQPVEDLDGVYAASDAFLMCSRLDPQPNVGIDAMMRGLPVLGFAGSSGTAEVLSSDPETAALVAPYLDVQAVAGILCGLARDRAWHSAMRNAVQRVAEATFDIESYVARIDLLGRNAAAGLRAEDHRTLVESGLMESSLVIRPDWPEMPAENVAWGILQQWKAVGMHPTPLSVFRRPCAGFHPLAYAAAHQEACLEGGENPLVHWLRAGRPPGPWHHAVVTPLRAPRSSALRTALHGHFFYPELATELVWRLRANATPCDLFLTTESEAKAEALRRIVHAHAGHVEVTVIPNRGRNIGALLSVLPRVRDQGYEVMGHVHGKRSPGIGDGQGDRWRDFLWENLIGPDAPMADTAADAFARHPEYGLMMVEDPNIVGWDKNRAIAEALAAKMGLTDGLETFFDFPVGAMFWARVEALLPLLRLDLTWDDYPDEPVPYDGTILHAIERLLPYVVRSTGRKVAGLRVPGTSW